jgi:hypothetical protein
MVRFLDDSASKSKSVSCVGAPKIKNIGSVMNSSTDIAAARTIGTQIQASAPKVTRIEILQPLWTLAMTIAKSIEERNRVCGAQN